MIVVVVTHYVGVMSKDGEWETQAEIFAASDLFDRDIYVYTKYGAGHQWLRICDLTV